MDDQEITADIDGVNEAKGFSFGRFALGAIAGLIISVVAIGALSVGYMPEQAARLDSAAVSEVPDAPTIVEAPKADPSPTPDQSEAEAPVQEIPIVPAQPSDPEETVAPASPPIVVAEEPVTETTDTEITVVEPTLDVAPVVEPPVEQIPDNLEAEPEAPAKDAPRAELPVEGDPVIIETDTQSVPEADPATGEAAEEPTLTTPSLPVKRAPKRNSPELQIALDKDDPNRLAFKVPKRREKNTGPAWERNAIAFTAAEDMPLIAIILEAPNDSTIPEDLLFDLSLPLTMSIVPRTSADAAFGASARASGFEVMARLPVQDRVNRDGSQDRIHIGMSEPEAREMTRRFLARMPVAVGATSFGSRAASQNALLMNAVIGELGAGGYAFVDDSQVPNGIRSQIAQDMDAIFVETNRRITADLTDAQVYSLLEGAAQDAANGDTVVLSAETERGTLIGIQRWALERNAKNARIAPLTAVLGRL